MDDDDEELVGTGKRVRSVSYTEDEDRVLCESWMIHGQDAKVGTQQKGKAYWKKVHRCFHQMRKFNKWNFESDRNINSLTKRWGHIQAECNKFNGAHDRILARPESGLGVHDVMVQVVKDFKDFYGTKFTLIHCQECIKDCPE